MALTNKVTSPNAAGFVIGNQRAVLVEVTADDAYPEGGYDFDPASFGITGKPVAVFASARAGLCPGNFTPVVAYDRENKKLLVYGTGTSVAYTEMCACDLTSLVVDVLIVEGNGQ